MSRPFRIIFVLLAVAWFSGSLIGLERGDSQLVVLLGAYPVGAALIDATDALPWMPGALAAVVPYVAIAANALFWAGILMGVARLLLHASLLTIFLVSAAVSFLIIAVLVNFGSGSLPVRYLAFNPAGILVAIVADALLPPQVRDPDAFGFVVFIGMLAATALCLAAVVTGAVWLARRNRRTINAPAQPAPPAAP